MKVYFEDLKTNGRREITSSMVARAKLRVNQIAQDFYAWAARQQAQAIQHQQRLMYGGYLGGLGSGIPLGFGVLGGMLFYAPTCPHCGKPL